MAEDRKTSRFKGTIEEPGGRSSTEVIAWAFSLMSAKGVIKRAYNKKTNRMPEAYLKVSVRLSPASKEGEIVPDDDRCHVFHKGERWPIS